MNKKALLKVAFITVSLFSAIVVTQLVHLGSANPAYAYRFRERISPPSDVQPPIISINPPINNTVYAQNEISLTLNVDTPEKYGLRIYDIYIKLWNGRVVKLYDRGDHGGLPINDFYDDLTLPYAPEGPHNVTFIINVHGGWIDRVGRILYYFDMTSYSNIYFTIDTTSPSVSISSIENRTYETSDIPLNFAVNEPVSQVSYSLDGQENVTVAGNTMLTGLPSGDHNVTVYAWDEAGNVGASETVYFSVEVPFPATMVIAPIASVAFVGVGLMVYLKKRKR